jgi:hypothetical protein
MNSARLYDLVEKIARQDVNALKALECHEGRLGLGVGIGLVSEATTAGWDFEAPFRTGIHHSFQDSTTC